MCGARTNVITSLEVTMGWSHDTRELPKLVAQTGKHFDMKEVSADKAYSSRANLSVIDYYGSTPYLPFKKGTSTKARGSSMWRKSYLFFQNNTEEFYKKYHLRSNVESSFSAIKRKFGSKVYARNIIAQTNEIYLKCIAFNISILIKFLYEMGVEIDFNKSSGDKFSLDINV